MADMAAGQQRGWASWALVYDTGSFWLGEVAEELTERRYTDVVEFSILREV